MRSWQGIRGVLAFFHPIYLIDCRRSAMQVGRTGPAGNKNGYVYVQVSVPCLSLTDFLIPEEYYRDRDWLIVSASLGQSGYVGYAPLSCGVRLGLDMT